LYTNDPLDYNYQGGLITQLRAINPDATNLILNGLIHHRQGPYGWPTWKQIRGSEHPIVRNHRKTNTFSTL